MIQAEIQAQSSGTGIGDPGINSRGNTRDYTDPVPWWHYRDSAVQEFRLKGYSSSDKSLRLDYEAVNKAAQGKKQIPVFGDLQNGIDKWCVGGALIYAGSPQHKFNLWIPDRDSPASQKILRLLQARYADKDRGYVYVTRTARMYPENEGYGKPEIIITDINQISDTAPLDGGVNAPFGLFHALF